MGLGSVLGETKGSPSLPLPPHFEAACHLHGPLRQSFISQCSISELFL